MPEIAALAQSVGAWLHVDAAYGGVLLFSPLHRDKLQGIALADSLSIDFHKLFWQPIPAGAFLLRDAGHFKLFELHADYLNPETHEAQGIPDLVTRSLLTTRRFDVLKPWLSFQLLGRRKLGAMIDRTIALAHCAADAVRRDFFTGACPWSQSEHCRLSLSAGASRSRFRWLECGAATASVRSGDCRHRTHSRRRPAVFETYLYESVSQRCADGRFGFDDCRAWAGAGTGLAVAQV